MSRRQGRRGPRRQANTTVLVVAEGHSEVAFLRYLKSLYVPRGCGVAVTVSNAHGKGPAHVIDHAIGQMRSPNAYKLAAVLFDDDLPCPASHVRKARKHALHLLRSAPCFEALLLEILARHVPARAQHCKARFDVDYGIDRCDPDGYAPLFPKTTLEARRPEVLNLDALCRLMEGRLPFTGALVGE